MSILTINVNNIVKNYQIVKGSLTSKTKVSCVVKADCYGLRVREIVPKLLQAGCDEFYIATLSEGIELRNIIGEKAQVFVLNGIDEGEEQNFHDYKLIPVLNNKSNIEIWCQYAKKINQKLPAILNIDTGMTRLGIEFSIAEKTINDIQKENLLEILYISSHLACADDTSHPLNKIQLNKFQSIANKYPQYKYSFANSAGFLLGKEYWYDQIRLGIILYGVNVSHHQGFTFFPVINLKSQIIQIYEVTDETTIGYCSTYRLKPGMITATIPVGYADGYFRCLSNKGFCCINGIKTPVIGNISMDLTTIDISSIPRDLQKIGQEVELIGTNISLETIASIANTISYEVLTSIGKRYKREYIK